MWVDLFTYMFAQPNTTVQLRSSDITDTDLGAYITLGDPETTITLRQGTYPYSKYISAGAIPFSGLEDIGNVLSLEYQQGETQVWLPEAVYTYISTEDVFSLIDQKIRVRAIPVSSGDGNVDISSMGTIGFIYTYTTGGHFLNQTIVNYGLDTVPLNTPLPWLEYTILSSDIVDTPDGPFVGIGMFSPGDEFSSPGFELLAIEFQIWVEEALPTTTLPWWMCPPKETIEPCPIRPTGFVPFDEYDVDFKFPLSSSRVPAKNPISTDCITCRPNLVDDSESPP